MGDRNGRLPVQNHAYPKPMRKVNNNHINWGYKWFTKSTIPYPFGIRFKDMKKKKKEKLWHDVLFFNVLYLLKFHLVWTDDIGGKDIEHDETTHKIYR